MVAATFLLRGVWQGISAFGMKETSFHVYTTVLVIYISRHLAKEFSFTHVYFMRHDLLGQGGRDGWVGKDGNELHAEIVIEKNHLHEHGVI